MIDVLKAIRAEIVRLKDYDKQYAYERILEVIDKYKAESEDKQIQKCENKQLIDELLKMPPMVIATASIYAINSVLYGEDVTEKWLTATQQSSALEKAYEKGYYDALQMFCAEREENKEVSDEST